MECGSIRFIKLFGCDLLTIKGITSNEERDNLTTQTHKHYEEVTTETIMETQSISATG